MPLSNNQQAFLALVKAGLWEQDVRLSGFKDIDYNEVYRLAEEQSVVGLVAAGLEHLQDVQPPKEILLQFIGQSLQLEQRNIAMNKFVADLVEKMRKVGIYTLLVKGQGTAQCYERPLWRAAGDVDLFLSDDNYQKAKKILLPLSSNCEAECVNAKHLGMTIDSWIVELHGNLRCSLSPIINKELDKIKDDTFYSGNVRLWQNNGVQIFLLGVENDIFYSFIHYLNHFYKGGLGLRQICDWCRILWFYRDVINNTFIESRINRLRLKNEWVAFSAFAVEILGMPIDAMPFYKPSRKYSRKVTKICSFILEVGNFGHNRDFSYYSKYPYVIRKILSLCRVIGDLVRHARIFPLSSIRFLPNILFYGIRSAINGE